MAALQSLISNKDIQFIFVGGKGGVGKTTNSATLALKLAAERTGNVLLMSTDPAHNLSDAFMQQFCGEPVLVDGTSNLFALETDPSVMMEQQVDEATAGQEERLVHDFRTWMSTVPGIDEAMALTTVLGHIDSGKYEVVVFDTAPTGHTLRLLQLPDVLKAGIDKLNSWSAKLGGLMSNVGSLLTGGSSESADEAASTQSLSEKLEDYKAKIERIGELFRDTARTTFVCVCIAEHLSVFETRRLIAELDKGGIACGYILCNQLVPRALQAVTLTSGGAEALEARLLSGGTATDTAAAVRSACELCGARARIQSKYLGELEAAVEGRQTVVRLPLLPGEVRGLANLNEFGRFYLEPDQALENIDAAEGDNPLSAAAFESSATFGTSFLKQAAEGTEEAEVVPMEEADELPGGIRIGGKVELHGLAKAADYNGLVGEVEAYDEESGRFAIRVEGKKGVKVKPANLAPREDLTPKTPGLPDDAMPPVSAAVAELDPALKGKLMQEVMSGGLDKILETPEMASLKEDAEVRPFFDDYAAGGMFGVMKYLSNDAVMSKLLAAYAQVAG